MENMEPVPTSKLIEAARDQLLTLTSTYSNNHNNHLVKTTYNTNNNNNLSCDSMRITEAIKKSNDHQILLNNQNISYDTNSLSDTIPGIHALKWATNLNSLLLDPDGVKAFTFYLGSEGYSDKPLMFIFAVRGLKKRNATLIEDLQNGKDLSAQNCDEQQLVDNKDEHMSLLRRRIKAIYRTFLRSNTVVNNNSCNDKTSIHSSSSTNLSCSTSPCLPINAECRKHVRETINQLFYSAHQNNNLLQQDINGFGSSSQSSSNIIDLIKQYTDIFDEALAQTEKHLAETHYRNFLKSDVYLSQLRGQQLPGDCYPPINKVLPIENTSQNISNSDNSGIQNSTNCSTLSRGRKKETDDVPTMLTTQSSALVNNNKILLSTSTTKYTEWVMTASSDNLTTTSGSEFLEPQPREENPLAGSSYCEKIPIPDNQNSTIEKKIHHKDSNNNMPINNKTVTAHVRKGSIHSKLPSSNVNATTSQETDPLTFIPKLQQPQNTMPPSDPKIFAALLTAKLNNLLNTSSATQLNSRTINKDTIQTTKSLSLTSTQIKFDSSHHANAKTSCRSTNLVDNEETETSQSILDDHVSRVWAEEEPPVAMTTIRKQLTQGAGGIGDTVQSSSNHNSNHTDKALKIQNWLDRVATYDVCPPQQFVTQKANIKNNYQDDISAISAHSSSSVCNNNNNNKNYNNSGYHGNSTNSSLVLVGGAKSTQTHCTNQRGYVSDNRDSKPNYNPINLNGNIVCDRRGVGTKNPKNGFNAHMDAANLSCVKNERNTPNHIYHGPVYDSTNSSHVSSYLTQSDFSNVAAAAPYSESNLHNNSEHQNNNIIGMNNTNNNTNPPPNNNVNVNNLNSNLISNYYLKRASSTSSGISSMVLGHHRTHPLYMLNQHQQNGKKIVNRPTGNVSASGGSFQNSTPHTYNYNNNNNYVHTAYNSDHNNNSKISSNNYGNTSSDVLSSDISSSYHHSDHMNANKGSSSTHAAYKRHIHNKQLCNSAVNTSEFDTDAYCDDDNNYWNKKSACVFTKKTGGGGGNNYYMHNNNHYSYQQQQQNDDVFSMYTSSDSQHHYCDELQDTEHEDIMTEADRACLEDLKAEMISEICCDEDDQEEQREKETNPQNGSCSSTTKESILPVFNSLKIGEQTEAETSNPQIQQVPNAQDKTIVGYFFCNEPVPYRTKIAGRNVTLKQFKTLISKKGKYRYYFKKSSDEFQPGGVINEEISDDEQVLPLWDGKIFAKIEPTE